MSEFSFIEHELWLKPFLVHLKDYYINQLSEQLVEYSSDSSSTSSTDPYYNTDSTTSMFTDTLVTYEDAVEFAIYNLNAVFRNTCTPLIFNRPSWIDCIPKEKQSNDHMCRISIGFGSRLVPFTKKFNPLFRQEKHKNAVLLAEYSYNYLYYHHEIEQILNTPLSDYTRYMLDNDKNLVDKIFIANLRYIQSKQKGHSYMDILLSTYWLKTSSSKMFHK